MSDQEIVVENILINGECILIQTHDKHIYIFTAAIKVLLNYKCLFLLLKMYVLVI